MGTTAREGPRKFGKGRSCPSDGKRPSVVVLQSAWGELVIERAAHLPSASLRREIVSVYHRYPV